MPPFAKSNRDQSSTSMAGLGTRSRGANVTPCKKKQDIVPAPEIKRNMIAKRLTRLQHKVADESCCFRVPTGTLSSRSCHCLDATALVTPDSQSHRVETKCRPKYKGKQGETLRVRDDSFGGDSSSAADLTDTLTVSVTSLDRATLPPSSSLKSCLSSMSSFDHRGDGSKNRRVSFKSIEIRRYPVILGDHPEVYVGPPIQLDWAYFPMKPIDIDTYESHRSEKNRRTGNELVLPAYIRRKILNHEYTNDEIIKRIKEVKTVQSQRDRTVQLLPFAKIEEGAQSAKRKARRAATRVLHKNCSTLSDTATRPRAAITAVIRKVHVDSRQQTRSQSFASIDRRRTILSLNEQYSSSHC